MTRWIVWGDVLFFLNKNVYAYALHDIKDIFVFATIKSRFFFSCISMQIKNVDFIKSFHQRFTHLPMDDSIYKAIIWNICKNSFAVLFHIIMPQANEFDVIVRKRLDISLFQIFLIDFRQFLNPRTFIATTYAIRRIPHHHHYRCVAFDKVRLISFLSEPLSKQRSCIVVTFFKRICQEYAKTLILFSLIACLRKHHI